MKDKLYRISPIWIKTILLNIKAWSNAKKRYTQFFLNYLEEYNNLWKANLEDIVNYQEKQLKRLLLEAFDFSNFYQERFKAQEINKQDIENAPYDVLKRLPILSKEDRKNKVDEIVNKNPNRPQSEIGFTSGTSGSPTINYLDAESTERAFALWTRFHKNIGIEKGERNIRFSGRLIISPTRKREPFWIFNKIDNQLFMSPYHLTNENMKAFVNKINDFKPALIDGYPSAIYVIAQYINVNKIKFDFKPTAIAVTAETLYDYQRLEIETAFNCKVYNQYASSEGSPFITECVDGRLHINEDSGVFEFLNKHDEPCRSGEVGRMVVTSFRSWKTPLIRYDIQDTVLLPLTQEACTCGCKMPYVEKLIGREDDVLWTKEKGYVGRMDTAYKGLKGIEKSQIIQTTPLNVLVNQTVNDEYNQKLENLLIQNIKDRLGESIDIKINIVEEIPLGPNGKFDAVKREFEIPE